MKMMKMMKMKMELMMINIRHKDEFKSELFFNQKMKLFPMRLSPFARQSALNILHQLSSVAGTSAAALRDAM